MTRRSIMEYAETLRGRCLQASKEEKGKMLDEFTKVTGLHPPAPHLAEQVALPHDPEHLLVVRMTASVPQFMSNPPVAIAGILKIASSAHPVWIMIPKQPGMNKP